jgi:8-oxo-dGTP pyrophosphatase MutT (NUDIX family)
VTEPTEKPPETPLAGIHFNATSVTTPTNAATVIVVRPGTRSSAEVEIFAVVRNPKSGFLGGALVFPGGKVDPTDHGVNLVHGPASRWAHLDASHELATCAVRELLEEAGLLDTDATPELVREARKQLLGGAAFGDVVLPLAPTARGLVPFARWITPRAESRRFDTRFFVYVAPNDTEADHDGHETVAGFWVTPREAIEKFHAGEVMLAPPTLRVFELLSSCATTGAAVALANEQSLAPICPEFIPGDPPMLVLPGDPLHSEPDVRCALGTRFVLKEGRFQSE